MDERSLEPQLSTREKARTELVEEALNKPGIREIMRVYEDWRHVDRGLDSYRATTREPQHIMTTDHANQK